MVYMGGVLHTCMHVGFVCVSACVICLFACQSSRAVAKHRRFLSFKGVLKERPAKKA